MVPMALPAVQLSTPGLTIINHLTLLSPTDYLVSCVMLLIACSTVLQLVKKFDDCSPCPSTVFVSDPNMPKLHSMYAVDEETISFA